MRPHASALLIFPGTHWSWRGAGLAMAADGPTNSALLRPLRRLTLAVGRSLQQLQGAGQRPGHDQPRHLACPNRCTAHAAGVEIPPEICWRTRAGTCCATILLLQALAATGFRCASSLFRSLPSAAVERRAQARCPRPLTTLATVSASSFCAGSVKLPQPLQRIRSAWPSLC